MELEMANMRHDTSLFDSYEHFGWFEGASADAIAQIVERRSYQIVNLSCLQYQIKEPETTLILDKGMGTFVYVGKLPC